MELRVYGMSRPAQRSLSSGTEDPCGMLLTTTKAPGLPRQAKIRQPRSGMPQQVSYCSHSGTLTRFAALHSVRMAGGFSRQAMIEQSAYGIRRMDIFCFRL